MQTHSDVTGESNEIIGSRITNSDIYDTKVVEDLPWSDVGPIMNSSGTCNFNENEELFYRETYFGDDPRRRFEHEDFNGNFMIGQLCFSKNASGYIKIQYGGGISVPSPPENPTATWKKYFEPSTSLAKNPTRLNTYHTINAPEIMNPQCGFEARFVVHEGRIVRGHNFKFEYTPKASASGFENGTFQ